MATLAAHSFEFLQPMNLRSLYQVRLCYSTGVSIAVISIRAVHGLPRRGTGNGEAARPFTAG
jgi:hypothetical protein